MVKETRWSVAMQFAPAKVSITQLVLSFLRSVSDAVIAKQYSAAYIFALFILIADDDSKIKSCISLLNNKNLKNFITFTKMEKYGFKLT
jgi:hypothetical protein